MLLSLLLQSGNIITATQASSEYVLCAKRKIGCAYNLHTNSLLLIGFCIGYGDFSDLVIQH